LKKDLQFPPGNNNEKSQMTWAGDSRFYVDFL